MRSILLLVVYVSLLTNLSQGQDCKSYYFLQQNKTIEMTIYNKKGDANGKQVYTVSNVTNNGGSTSATVNSEMFSQKGKSIAKGHSEIKCTGGVMMIDMTMQLPQQQQEQFARADVKADKIYIEYPVNMKAGDKLKDATLDMTIDNSGMKQSVNMVTSDRTVIGKESVTTTAGTWDCFKITFKSKITIKTMGIGMPFNMEGTEWFAPGFGIVKTESKHGGTAITAIK
jgi:uncharacterized protein DUF3108